MRSQSRLRNGVGEAESFDEVVRSKLGEESFLEDDDDPFKKAHSGCFILGPGLPSKALTCLHDALAIKFNQPVGSMSISPASRDVALAS